jgi:hypothetical protein
MVTIAQEQCVLALPEQVQAAMADFAPRPNM